MPELPEVETTRRGIAPHAEQRKVSAIRVRERRLRWPVPRELEQQLPGSTIGSISRRGKYLLFATDTGTLIVHLGMSGSLRVLTEWQEIKEIDWASKKPLLNSPVLVDFRNLYEPETMSKLGYHYASLGRPVIAAWHG